MVTYFPVPCSWLLCKILNAESDTKEEHFTIVAPDVEKRFPPTHTAKA